MKTVVSIFPYRIKEEKPLFPNLYILEPGTYDKPSLLYVKDGERSVYIDWERGSIRVPVSANEIAESVVKDFHNACMAYGGDNKRAGLFVLDGKLTVEQVLSYQNKPDVLEVPAFDEEGNFLVDKDGKSVIEQIPNPLKQAKKAQDAWFLELVRMADDEYAKHKRPGQVSDLQRLAAKSLGFDREWILNILIKDMSCPFCSQSIRDSVVVCPHCNHVVDSARYNELVKRIPQEVSSKEEALLAKS